MPLLRQCRRMLKKVAFGDTLLPQEFTIGLAEPQTEISVWLHGIGMPRDVTGCHTTACAAPLTVCVALDEGHRLTEKDLGKAVLKFCERGGRRRVLGEIRLSFKTAISIGPSEFVLFR